MKSTAAAVLAILAATAEASPLALRDNQVCNTTPAGAGSPSPLSKPSAATAQACQAACSANSQCKCFVFGLPANLNAPECILYAVPGAQVPAQGDNLHVFDVACSAAQVPTTAPTHDQPFGQVPRSLMARAAVCNIAPSASGSRSPISQPTAATALVCQQACTANSQCQSFCFGLPDSATTPECFLYDVPAAQVPVQGNLHVFDLACAATQVPTTAPTHDQPIGQVPSNAGNTGNTGNTGNNNNNGAQNGNTGANTGNNGQQNGQTGAQTGQNGAQNGAQGQTGQTPRGLIARASVCNSSPPGTGSKTPISQPSASTAVLCQSACAANTNCQAFCFGLPPSDSTPKCLLFDVPAAQVPSQGTDLNVFDLACPAAQIPSTAPTHDQPIGQVPATGNTGNNNGGAQTGNNGAQNGQNGAQNGAQGQH